MLASPPTPTFHESASTAYMIRRPRDRVLATWHAGQLGPYGDGPDHPRSFLIDYYEKDPSSFEATLPFIQVSGLALVAIFVGWKFWLISHPRPVIQNTLLNGDALNFNTTSVSVRRRMEDIRRWDPGFSVVLFEDFVYALFTEAQTARGRHDIHRLAPYLGDAARSQLEALGAFPVTSIVVGALRFRSYSGGPRLFVEVEIETNYAEQHPEGKCGFYARETWRLSRGQETTSRPPDRARVLDCPSCAAPLDRVFAGTCQYCGRKVTDGQYDWIVADIAISERNPRGPMLTETIEERGTDLATVHDADVGASLECLRNRQPPFDETTFRIRVARIFQVVQEAWSSLQWEKARAFLTDNLFESQAYWIAAYRAQGLRNRTSGARITAADIVRVTEDHWFVAITIRLFATGLDYTCRASDGQIVAGSDKVERAYSEYWTLIRGTALTGTPHTDTSCPSCGAPLELSMTAKCQHCHVKVNSGAFDWVLSRIEQDDVYSG